MRRLLVLGVWWTITAPMMVFLLFPRWLKLGHVDVIRATGMLLTRNEQKAFGIGLIVHIASGIAFAFIYLGVFGLMSLPLNLMTGFLGGAVHGVIVTLLVSITIMEHHPIANYRDRGPMTGLMQFLAHVIYGVLLGATVQIFSV